MKLNLNVSNSRKDSLTTKLTAEDFYMGTLHLPDLEMKCGMKDNFVDLSATFRDSVKRSSGDIEERSAD